MEFIQKHSDLTQKLINGNLEKINEEQFVITRDLTPENKVKMQYRNPLGTSMQNADDAAITRETQIFSRLFSYLSKKTSETEIIYGHSAKTSETRLTNGHSSKLSEKRFINGELKSTSETRLIDGNVSNENKTGMLNGYSEKVVQTGMLNGIFPLTNAAEMKNKKTTKIFETLMVSGNLANTDETSTIDKLFSKTSAAEMIIGDLEKEYKIHMNTTGNSTQEKSSRVIDTYPPKRNCMYNSFKTIKTIPFKGKVRSKKRKTTNVLSEINSPLVLLHHLTAKPGITLRHEEIQRNLNAAVLKEAMGKILLRRQVFSIETHTMVQEIACQFRSVKCYLADATASALAIPESTFLRAKSHEELTAINTDLKDIAVHILCSMDLLLADLEDLNNMALDFVDQAVWQSTRLVVQLKRKVPKLISITKAE